jgi:hypothetical protein
MDMRVIPSDVDFWIYVEPGRKVYGDALGSGLTPESGIGG